MTSTRLHILTSKLTVRRYPCNVGEDVTRFDASNLADVEAPSSRDRATPAVGSRVGKYVVQGALGAGGMGIVVAARHDELGELVAIKLLDPRAAKRDKLSRERFVREARAVVRIKSEHVVRVLDAGTTEHDGTPYIVMEYLEGQDLGALLESGPLPLSTAADYFLQICEAVAAAHAIGVVHRDLKPSNFFVTTRSDGTALVKVLDFGISKAVGIDEVNPRLTETTAVFGSPMYMPPEQVRSARNAEFRSDLWSLGVALFEALTGRQPFEAETITGLLASIVSDPPISPRHYRPDLPPDIEALLLRCLEKEPARRISSVQELAAGLRPYASAEGAFLADRIERMGRTGRPSAPPGSFDSLRTSASSFGAVAASVPSQPLSLAPMAPLGGSTERLSAATTSVVPRDVPKPATSRSWAAGAAVVAVIAGGVGSLVGRAGFDARPAPAKALSMSPRVAETSASPPAEPVTSSTPAPAPPGVMETGTSNERAAPTISAASPSPVRATNVAAPSPLRPSLKRGPRPEARPETRPETRPEARPETRPEARPETPMPKGPAASSGVVTPAPPPSRHDPTSERF